MEPDELLLYNYLKTTTPPHHESKSSTPTITDGRFKVTLIMAPLQYSTAPKLDPNHIKITLNLTYYDFSTLISDLIERISKVLQQESTVFYLTLSVVAVIVLLAIIFISLKLKGRCDNRFTWEPRHVRNRHNLRAHAVGNSHEYQRNVSAMPIEGEDEARLDFEARLAPLYTRTGKQQAKRLRQRDFPDASHKVPNKGSMAPMKGEVEISRAQKILPGSSSSTQVTQEEEPIRSALSRFYSTRSHHVEEEASANEDAFTRLLPSQPQQWQLKTWSRPITSYFTRSDRVNAARERDILNEQLRRANTTPRNTNSLFMIGRSLEEFPQNVPRMPSEGPEEAKIDWRHRLDPLYLVAGRVQAERAARQASKKKSKERLGSASSPKVSRYSSSKGKENGLHAPELCDELTPLLSATHTQRKRPSFSLIQSSNSKAERFPSEPSGTVRRSYQYPIDQAAQDEVSGVTTVGGKYDSKHKKAPIKGDFNTKGYKDTNDEPHIWQSRVTGEASGDFWTDSEEVKYPSGVSSRSASVTEFDNYLAMARKASESAKSKKTMTHRSFSRPGSSSTQSEPRIFTQKSLAQPILSSTDIDVIVNRNPSSRPPSTSVKSTVSTILAPHSKKVSVTEIIKKFEVTAVDHPQTSPKRSQSTFTQNKLPEKAGENDTKTSLATASKRSQSTYTQKKPLESSEVKATEQSQVPVTKRSQLTYRGRKVLETTSFVNDANKRTHSSRIPVKTPTLPPSSTIPVINTPPVATSSKTPVSKTPVSKIPVEMARSPAFDPAFDSPSRRDSARKFPKINEPTGVPAPSSPRSPTKGSGRCQTPAQFITPIKATRRPWK